MGEIGFFVLGFTVTLAIVCLADAVAENGLLLK